MTNQLWTARAIAVVLAIFISPTIAAQQSSETKLPSGWHSAQPPARDHDWLQTTGGEWLKGELRVLYAGVLEFDSDELGVRSIDFDDVAQFLGHDRKRINIDTIDGYLVLRGFVALDGKWLVIEMDDQVRTVDRDQLISITPDATGEKDNWSARIGLGFKFSTGNTRQVDKNIDLLLRRRTPENRMLINYLGLTSEVNDTETINNHRANLLYDIFPDRHFYWRPVSLEYYRDPFQNIEYRITLGAGAGYSLFDNPDVSWEIFGGPAYRLTRYDSVEAGEDDSSTTPALVIGTFFDTSITSTVDFRLFYDFGIVNEESGSYTHQARATFGFDLTEIIDLDLSLLWDRTRDPQPRADGSLPDQDDFLWTLTLGLEF